MQTYEDTSESKGSEDESESEDDFEGDSDSEDEFDFEGEFDSNPDSDGDSDSGGDPKFRNIPYSEGGHASKAGIYGVPASNIVPTHEEDSEQVQMPQRIRNIPRWFKSLACCKILK